MNTATEIQEQVVTLPDLSSLGDELDLCSSKIVCLSCLDFQRTCNRDEAITGFRNSMEEIGGEIDAIAATLHDIYFSGRN